MSIIFMLHALLLSMYNWYPDENAIQVTNRLTDKVIYFKLSVQICSFL